MKIYLLLLIAFVQFLSFSQGTTGIYKVRWSIDNRLTNRVVINNNGFGNDLNIPQNLYDSVVNEMIRIVAQEMHSDTRLIYPINRNGKEMRTGSSAEQVGGLPRGTKRRAMGTEYMEYYVKFKIRVGVNKTMSLGGEMASYSRLRPYVRVKMKAFGIDRRVKKRKRVRTGGFNSIGSFEFNMGGTTVTNNNTLPIDEVLDMVFKGLDKFENKVR
jgi:hypothetical protein